MQKVHEIQEDISKYNQDFSKKYNEMNDMMKEKFNGFIKEIQNFNENFKFHWSSFIFNQFIYFSQDSALQAFLKMDTKMRDLGNKLNLIVNEVSEQIAGIPSLVKYNFENI